MSRLSLPVYDSRGPFQLLPQDSGQRSVNLTDTLPPTPIPFLGYNSLFYFCFDTTAPFQLGMLVTEKDVGGHEWYAIRTIL